MVLLPAGLGAHPTHRVRLLESGHKVGCEIVGPKRTTRWWFEPGRNQVDIDVATRGEERRYHVEGPMAAASRAAELARAPAELDYFQTMTGQTRANIAVLCFVVYDGGDKRSRARARHLFGGSTSPRRDRFLAGTSAADEAVVLVNARQEVHNETQGHTYPASHLVNSKVALAIDHVDAVGSMLTAIFVGTSKRRLSLE